MLLNMIERNWTTGLMEGPKPNILLHTRPDDIGPIFNPISILSLIQILKIR